MFESLNFFGYSIFLLSLNVNFSHTNVQTNGEELIKGVISMLHNKSQDQYKFSDERKYFPAFSTSAVSKATKREQSLFTRATPSLNIESFPLMFKLSKSNTTENKIKIKDVTVHKTKLRNTFCKHDLQLGYCNINCCCDADCDNDVLKTFEREEIWGLKDELYKSDLPLCSIADKWFCILKKNTNEKYTTIFNKKEFDQKQKYQWKFPFLTPKPNSADEYYKYKDPIKIFINLIHKISEMEMPFPIMGEICNIFEPIRYMVNTDYKCIVSVSNYNLFVRYVIEKLSTAYFIENKNDLVITDSISMSYFQNYTKINIFSCIENVFNTLLNCSEVKNEDINKIKFWHKIEIKIQHNYTNLNRINLFLYMKDDIQNNLTQLYLNVKVKFILFNETNKNYQLISDFPGYIRGFPIFKSQTIFTNETEKGLENKWLIDYFNLSDEDFIGKSTIGMITSSEGICFKTKDNKLPIKFGESSIGVCEVNFKELHQLKHITEFYIACEILQLKIFDYLLDERNISINHNIFVSKLGNPKNSFEYWTKVELKNFEPVKILGDYIEHNETFICKNLILAVKIGFLYARLKINNDENQNVIKSVFYEFDSKTDLKFSLKTSHKFSISTSVMFYDITESANYLYLSKKLPIAIYLIFFQQIV